MNTILSNFDAIPQVAAMVNFDQKNIHHCYDLFDHTMVALAEVQKAGGNDLLQIAALFHDVAKPSCAMEKNGHLVFYGHAQKSAEMAEEILRSIGCLTDDEIAFICKIIGHHDDFINFKTESEYDAHNPWFKLITEDNLMAWQKKNDFSNEEVLALLTLCRADSNAQAEHVITDDGVELVNASRAAKVAKIDLIKSIFESAWDR